MKIAEKIKENKIFFTTFILLMVTGLTFILQRDVRGLVDNYYYPLYVINYDCGYSSRLLVGAVFSLFFKDTLDISILTGVLLSVYLAFCFCLSLFVNKHLKKTDFEAVGVYVAFMTVSPAFVSLLNYFGIVDIFWFFCVMGALCVVSKKGWRWLVPIFCAVGLAIHEVFLTTYLPVIAIAVLYQFIKKPKASSFVFVAVCAVIVGAASVYFLILGDGTMKMNSAEMIQFARDRLDINGKNFDEFYLKSVFFWETPGINGDEGFFEYLRYNFNILNSDHSRMQSVAFFALSNLLTLSPFVYLAVRAFGKEKNYGKRFVYLCSLMIFPLFIFQFLFSTDTERFAMHWLLSVLFLLLFFIREKDEAFCKVFEESRSIILKNKTMLAFGAIAVARIVLSGVRF